MPRRAAIPLLLAAGFGCSTFIQPPPLIIPARPAAPMAVGSTSVQLLAGTGFSGAGVFDDAAGVGGALRLEEQVHPTLSLGLELLGGCGGSSSMNNLLAFGRVYGHFTPFTDWLAFRPGLGAGLITGFVPFGTSDLSVQASKTLFGGVGASLSLGAATSTVLRSAANVESLIGHPPLQQTLFYGGGTAEVFYVHKSWSGSLSLMYMQDLQKSRFVTFSLFGGVRYVFGATPK